MSKTNINAINLNTKNFNYKTLSKQGVRGGMEVIVLDQQVGDGIDGSVGSD